MSDTKINVALPSKGLVVDRPAEYVDARAAANAKNMEFDRSTIRKRTGTESVGSSLGERVQKYFELVVGAETRLFRVGLTKVEVLNKSTGVWSSVASAALTGTDADPVSVAFPTLAGEKIAVFTNNVDALRKARITGNDAVLGGSPPKCKYLVADGPYLLLLNVTDGGNNFPSRVQWPDTGDPQLWTPAGDNNAGSSDLIDDGGPITGGGMFGNYVTVHKANSIYLGQRVSTSSVYRFDRRATGVGACAGNTILNLPSGEQIFLAFDGIHLFNGVTAPLIDSPINDELREGINPAAVHKSHAVFVAERDEYWVFVAMGSDTEPNTVYKYNWRTAQIYKDSRTNITAAGTYLNTNQDAWDDDNDSWDSDTTRWDSIENLSLNAIVIFGDSAGASTRRSTNTNNDAGSAVEAIWDTKDFTSSDAGVVDMDRLMRWKGLQIWAKGNSLKVYYSTNQGTTWIYAGVLALTSDYPQDDGALMVYFDKISSSMRFRFYNTESGESYTLKKYEVLGVPREARR